MTNLIPNRTDHHSLMCYRKAEAIYDVTYNFTKRFLVVGDRTIDQMVQAARSGKQNIVEGYHAGATSTEMELKLFNVAKSSLQELLADYEDFLRVREMRRWESGSAEFVYAKKLGEKHNDSAFWMDIVRKREAETVANIAIILLRQADYLIYRYLQSVGERFLRQGGFREKLTSERLKKRTTQEEKLLKDNKGY